MICAGSQTIHTIGHSTRTIAGLVELLGSHGIELVIDVRRWPMSRRHPHFNREALAHSLGKNRIEYEWRQDLGGFRKAAADSPNSGWRVATFRAYADFMLSTEFETTIAAVEKSAAAKRSALMCAEAVPWRCHRQLLADAFLVRGWQARHIMDDGCHPHKLPPFARVDGRRIVYAASVKEDSNGELF